MNGKKLLLALLSVSVFLLPSCKKSTLSDTTGTTSETQIVTATVTKNATYSYALSATTANYTIVASSVTSSSATIAPNTANTSTFIYAPAANFTGIDSVIIANGDTTHMHGGCQHMGNANGQAPPNRIVFHIHVVDSTTAN